MHTVWVVHSLRFSSSSFPQHGDLVAVFSPPWKNLESTSGFGAAHLPQFFSGNFGRSNNTWTMSCSQLLGAVAAPQLDASYSCIHGMPACHRQCLIEGWPVDSFCCLNLDGVQALPIAKVKYCIYEDVTHRFDVFPSPYWYLDTTDLMNGGTKVGPKAAKGSGPGMLQVLWIEVAQPRICIRQNGRWCLCRSKQSVQRALQQNLKKWGRCRICEEPFRPCGEDTWRERLHTHSYYNPNDKRVVTMGGNWGCGNCWGLLTTCWRDDPQRHPPEINMVPKINSLLVSLDLHVHCLEKVPKIFSQMVMKYGDGEIPWYNPFKKTPPKKKTHTHPDRVFFPKKMTQTSTFHIQQWLVYQMISEMTWKKKTIDHRWEKTAKSQWQ